LGYERKELKRLYIQAYHKIREHGEIVSAFDKLAHEIWSYEALQKEYNNDRGLTDVILYGIVKPEFKAFCKRMDMHE